MVNEEIIFNIQTGAETRQPLSEETLLFHAKVNKEMATKLKESADKATAKAALLEKLGITAEEAALLLS